MPHFAAVKLSKDEKFPSNQKHQLVIEYQTWKKKHANLIEHQINPTMSNIEANLIKIKARDGDEC